MIQSDIYGLLGTTFGGRLYPMIAPYKPTAPFGVYTRVSTVPASIHGVGGLQESRIQIDIYADTYAAALTLANTVKTNVQASLNLASVSLSDADEYEPDTKFYRVILEFTFWH